MQAGKRAPRWADAWLMDDGQIFCKPEDADNILRTLDVRLEEAGSTRGWRSRGDTIKSTIMFLGTDQQVTEAMGSVTPYITETCEVLEYDDRRKVLGGSLGGSVEQHTEFFEKITRKAAELHDSIGMIDDPATGYVLKSACAGVCKVGYSLRLNGDVVSEKALLGFEETLRTSLGTTLEGGIEDAAWEQATCGETVGGCGWRTPDEICLPAFLSSRTTCRPAAASLFRQLEQMGLTAQGQLLA